MAPSPDPRDIRYARVSPPGAGQYDVYYRGALIGRVGRFRMGAGQFGSRWMATTPSRRKSGQYVTRDAAAMWLVEQARA